MVCSNLRNFGELGIKVWGDELGRDMTLDE